MMLSVPILKHFRVLQLVVRLAEELEIPGLTPSLAHTSVEIDHEIFSTVILPFSLIQEGHLSVTGKSMGT